MLIGLPNEVGATFKLIKLSSSSFNSDLKLMAEMKEWLNNFYEFNGNVKKHNFGNTRLMRGEHSVEQPYLTLLYLFSYKSLLTRQLNRVARTKT
jgi:hypothetical protein